MKILQVTGFPNNGAGSGTLITTQAEGLVKDGNEVCCILSENSSITLPAKNSVSV